MGKRFNPVLNKRYKAVDIVKVALGQNSVETGTSNPVDLFHQAYFICYNSGSCDTGATKSMEIVRPLTGRFVRQTVVMRASGHYWDGDMGGLLIRYAEKAAEKGQTWRAVPVIVREYPLIEFHDFWTGTGVDYVGSTIFSSDRAITGFMDITLKNEGGPEFQCGKFIAAVKGALGTVPLIGPYIATGFDVS